MSRVLYRKYSSVVEKEYGCVNYSVVYKRIVILSHGLLSLHGFTKFPATLNGYCLPLGSK